MDTDMDTSDTGQQSLDPSQQMDRWQSIQDGQSSRINSFERVFENVRNAGEQSSNNGTSENQSYLSAAKMDSLEKAFPSLKSIGSNERLDSTVQLILQALASGTDVTMDSLESVPSSVINAVMNDQGITSLPRMDDTAVEQTLTQEGSNHMHPALHDELVMSPPDNNLEATYATLQTHSPMQQTSVHQTVIRHPMDQTSMAQGQMHQYMVQQIGMIPTVDPNEEIHAGPGMRHYNPRPPEPRSEPVMFHPATSTRQVAGHDPHRNDEVTSVQSSDSDESYKLSPENRLEIAVCYSNLPVSGTVIVDRLDGCIMYYEKASRELLDRCQCVPFPSLENTEIGKKFAKVSSKAMELTGRALDALQGGLRLQWTSEGVYATRLSRGKIYWTSTQMGNDTPLAQELTRNTPTLVFQWDSFRLHLSQMYTLKAQGKKYSDPLLPAVFFTFAQKWARETCPISNCLVWAKVIPKKAEEMVVGLFPDAKSAPYASLNSGFIQVSN